ncbi:MAG TPA: PQQ-binding-like beta-propeller repeat protein, partial [Planctomycetaceae bacterium]|nr:PQQ-binding-like beta-propeller repeat protein [Planctomycetaceae bacterium]
LPALSEGQQISVFTSSSGAVTKLVVRTSSSSAGSAATPVRPKSTKTKKDKASAEPADEAGEDKAGDSPQFRGPRRDGHAGTQKIAASWPSSGPKPLWSASGLGEGYAAVSVANGRVYTMGLVANDEKVLALDEKSGSRLWSTSTGGDPFKEGQGNGPRCTPTVDGDRVYAMGCFGDLVCLDAKSGQRRWHKNVLKEFGFRDRTIHWGICESPLIDGDKLIVTPGGSEATMVALNKNSGSVLWKSKAPGNPPAGYASAIAIEVGGVRQYVNFTARSLIGVRAADGEFLWQNNSAANGTANCSAAVFHDNHVFYASGYGAGGACLRLESNGNTTKADEVYKTREMQNHHGGMVVVNGCLYGCNEKILTCLDLLSGKVMWQNRSVGKGSVTFADGMLIVRSENGPLALVEANSQRYVEQGRFEQPKRSNRPSWAYPVVANGRLLLRDLDLLLCYDLRRN